MLPDGGYGVRTWTVVEIWDAIELRAVLEGTAARLACERLVHRHELDVLRGYAHQIETISKPQIEKSRPDMEFFASYCELNIRFHTALMDLARCGILRKTWEQVQSIPFAAPSSTILPEAMPLILKSALEQHQAVLEAISKRDSARAENIARTHARLGFTNLDFALRSPKPEAALVKVSRPPLFDSGLAKK
jgi:GntR family transcriptional regulator of vanillate catabolism